MSDYIKVQGYNGLVRDTRSNAIVNKDKNAYNIAKRRQRKHKDNEMKSEVQLEK